ncbi:MAG: hypothetical protein ABL894_11830 [Hyphomicrobium sp.]
MLDMLNAILHVNFMTAIVVALLSASAGVIFREATNSNLMTAILVPVLAFGSLLSIYTLGQAGIFFTSQKEANAVVSSSVGMILALVAVLCVIRVSIAIGDMRRPPDAQGRIRDGETGT